MVKVKLERVGLLEGKSKIEILFGIRLRIDWD